MIAWSTHSVLLPTEEEREEISHLANREVVSQNETRKKQFHVSRECPHSGRSPHSAVRDTEILLLFKHSVSFLRLPRVMIVLFCLLLEVLQACARKYSNQIDFIFRSRQHFVALRLADVFSSPWMKTSIYLKCQATES